MYRMILILVSVLFSNISLGKGDTSWITVNSDYGCKNEMEQCFLDAFGSNDDSRVVESIYYYLDNVDRLSEHYSIGLFLEQLISISKVNENGAFLLEASIYYHGEHVPRDINKSIGIMESNRFFDYKDPVHLILLGKAYYMQFMLTGRSVEEYYVKARVYLLKAYAINNDYATRALAHILIRSNDSNDFALAGKLFEMYAKGGSENDKKSYQLYVDTLEGRSN